ncbi:hypothetical protein T484DRAFT_2901643 [Baffinella frigidus]|nr:hypothetical protein T484DRAFT_2901643 [Cryptophyta sp. CCMP2293]
MPWRELIFKADGTVGVPASWNTWKAPAGAKIVQAPAGAKIVQDDLLDLPEAMERLASDAASLSARSPQGLIGSKINWETTALCFPDDAAVKPGEDPLREFFYGVWEHGGQCLRLTGDTPVLTASSRRGSITAHQVHQAQDPMARGFDGFACRAFSPEARGAALSQVPRLPAVPWRHRRPFRETRGPRARLIPAGIKTSP